MMGRRGRGIWIGRGGIANTDGTIVTRMTTGEASVDDITMRTMIDVHAITDLIDAAVAHRRYLTLGPAHDHLGEASTVSARTEDIVQGMNGILIDRGHRPEDEMMTTANTGGSPTPAHVDLVRQTRGLDLLTTTARKSVVDQPVAYHRLTNDHESFTSHLRMERRVSRKMPPTKTRREQRNWPQCSLTQPIWSLSVGPASLRSKRKRTNSESRTTRSGRIADASSAVSERRPKLLMLGDDLGGRGLRKIECLSYGIRPLKLPS